MDAVEIDIVNKDTKGLPASHDIEHFQEDIENVQVYVVPGHLLHCS